MLRRFCLYGFLKNQQYYDPFMVLAFLQMGLSYTVIGVVVAFREIMINLMEIPSGAIADLWGRRRSMIMSFIAYICSFLIFGLCGLARMHRYVGYTPTVMLLLAAMLFFAVGDAFRTGTHKAMIFAWLRLQGREEERTRVYGYTRSWSKIGSAVSVVLACGFVFAASNFIYIFFFAIVPYVMNIINFLGYPAELDGETGGKAGLRSMAQHLKESFLATVQQPGLRGLVLESMGFEGFFKAAKDYLQPVLQAAALPATAVFLAGMNLSETRQSVVLIGPVFFILFILSAIASRKAHALATACGNENLAARKLWLMLLAICCGMLPAMYWNLHVVIIAGFVLLHVLQNLWRPVLVSRFDAHSDAAKGATILSIDSQAKSLATMVIAPGLGLAMDYAKAHQIGASEFWPIAVVGIMISLPVIAGRKRMGGSGIPAG